MDILFFGYILIMDISFFGYILFMFLGVSFLDISKTDISWLYLFQIYLFCIYLRRIYPKKVYLFWIFLGISKISVDISKKRYIGYIRKRIYPKDLSRIYPRNIYLLRIYPWIYQFPGYIHRYTSDISKISRYIFGNIFQKFQKTHLKGEFFRISRNGYFGYIRYIHGYISFKKIYLWIYLDMGRYIHKKVKISKKLPK